MTINEEVARAFGSHTLWKARIERAADAGKSEFKPEDVCKDTLCTFGKWLHDPKLPAEIRHSRHYSEVSRQHREFHQAAGAAIAMAVRGDAQGARRDIASGGYFNAGERFYEGMFSWQHDAAVGPRGPFSRLGGNLHLRLWGALLLPAASLASALWFDAPAEFPILLAAASAVAAFFLFRSVTRPLDGLTAVLRQLAKGDHSGKLPAMQRADRIGDLARAMLVFKEQAVAVERIAAVREREREKGEAERRDALMQMATNIEGQTASTVGVIARDSELIYETAKRMAKGAQNVEVNAQIVAAAAEQSLTNAETVSAATDTLSKHFSEISDQMQRSIAAVGEAVMAADNASDTVDLLGKAMADIDQVVQLIAEIAGQTNLLALNATIEAARAGEAGKGFAVVATEVKNLANQTARQTEEISGRIAHLSTMAKKVIDAIRSTVSKVQDVEQIASSVAGAVEEQHKAANEITRNVMDSSKAAREVSDRIIVVAEEAVNTGKQAGDVETMLHGMTDKVGELGRLLNRTVRTSTPEVNRRTAARHKIGIEVPVRVEGLGHELTGRVEDISVGGVQMSGLPEMPVGGRATLRLDDLVVLARVIESRGKICRMRIDEDKQSQVAAWIERKLGNSQGAARV